MKHQAPLVSGRRTAHRLDSPKRPPAGGWMPNVFAGTISGLMTLIASISYASLIFSGTLSSYLNFGIVSALVSAALIGLIVAWKSSSALVIAGPDANISAILAVIAAGIASGAGHGASPAALFSTIVAAMALSSLLTGIFLFLLGKFRQGLWIRFIPYPVVGGFLAGTGWLLVRGSFKVMCGHGLSLSQARALADPAMAALWGPGLAFGLLLAVILRLYKQAFLLPVLLILFTALFHAARHFLGISLASAGAKGWLFAPLPQNLITTAYESFSLASVDLAFLAREGANLAALMAVAAMVILLNAASIELATKKEIDLDHELITTGAANILAAPMGGLAGCIALSRSLLNHKAGARGRLSGVIAALLAAAVLFFGSSFLNIFPKAVLGGLLFFLGASLIMEWVYDGWRVFSRFDYILVIAILVIIGTSGFLPGISIGLIAACILFAVNYGRINVIKQEISGSEIHSNVERSFPQQRELREHRSQIRILRLQGYIFFGTAYTLLLHIQERLESGGSKPIRYLILDFSFISGIDSSSVLIFTKILDLARENRVKVIYVHMNTQVQRLLSEGGCLAPPAGAGREDHGCFLFPNLDYALEWCEDSILANAERTRIVQHESLETQLEHLFPNKDLIPALMRHLERVEAPSAWWLFRQGEHADKLYFVESGEVTAGLTAGDGTFKRLRTMGPGTVVGEMGLYLQAPRSASVVTERPSVLYRLSSGSLKEMEDKDPALASAFHLFIIRLLSYRLIHSNEVMSLLLK